MKSLMKQTPPIFKNMYVLGTVFFIVWLMIFDSNDILTQLSLRKKEAELQQMQRYYQKQIETVKTDREALFSNQDLLERIAREKYYMRAEGEDVYVMVPESTDE
jgi:cell division protein DivIC